MSHPSLRFALDPELDASLAWDFYSHPKYGGVDFWEKGALAYHEELKGLERKRNKKSFLMRYVLRLHRENAPSIQKRQREIESLYEEKRTKFFSAANRVFHDIQPTGRHTAYLSIFDFCPRFLKEKSFFVFLADTDENVLVTIFHELLHFYFYHYCLSVHRKDFRGLDTESGPFWELAELFNGVVMQTPAFSKLYKMEPSFGYTALLPAFKDAKRKWRGNLGEWMKTFALPYVGDV